MSAIRPNQAQFLELMNAPDEGPVVMLNLLKFKPRAGAAEYNKYGSSAVKMVEDRGGKLLWMGKVDQTLIGDIDADDWDAIALVQYPNRKAFIEMTASQEYGAAHEHRESGLERTVLLACTPRGGAL
ncbi:MAG TPA: DUF1330 domain-containing protein [Acidimicrobiia bacterium]|nr:DUF1330 domain-containing protein [Acidimicrobiia bacterium]